jgi:hypothetical protein
MKSVEMYVFSWKKSMNGVMWVALEVRSKIYLEAFMCHYRMNSCLAQLYRVKKGLAGNIDLYPNYVKRIFVKK